MTKWHNKSLEWILKTLRIFKTTQFKRSAAKNITIPKILFDDAQDIRLGLLKNERFEMAAINRLGT